MASNCMMGFWKKWRLRLVWFGALALCLVTCAGFGGLWHPWLDIWAHFRLQYLVLAALGVFLALAVRVPRAAAVAGLMFLLNLLAVLPHVGSVSGLVAKRAPGSRARIRVLHANVLMENRDYDRLLRMVPDARPDVIFAQEVDRRWVDVLDHALRPAYPYAITEPREDRFGIAAYSRLPLFEARVIYLEPDRARRAPVLALRIRRGSREIRLFSAHPPPPITLLSAAWRDRQIHELLTLADREGGPYALIGDLNNTPFSPVFQKWIRDSRLRNDQPPGSVYTWPSHTPALRIHIDHCLASEAVDRTALYTGPEIGSDHFPLICELEF